jgi:hypothetical protein
VPPTLTVPPAITRTTTDGADAVYISDASIGTATATDNVAGVTVTRSGVPAGNLFAVGVTTITWTATDAFGNTTVGTQLVTVLPSLPTVSVTATDAAGAEKASDPIVFTVSRTGSTAAALAIQMSFGGTASASDYTISVSGGSYSGGVLTIASGASAAVVTLRPVDDTAAESSESVTLSILAGTAYNRGTATSATGTIADDDTVTPPPPTTPVVSIVVTDPYGAENPLDPIVFVITRTGRTDTAITIQLSWFGTATFGAGKDYTVSATGGTLNNKQTAITLAAGVTSATIVVTPVRDSKSEAPETVTLSLGTGSGYTLSGPTSATATITDAPTATPAGLVGTLSTGTFASAAGAVAEAGVVSEGPAGTPAISTEPTTLALIAAAELAALGSAAPPAPADPRAPSPRPASPAVVSSPLRAGRPAPR